MFVMDYRPLRAYMGANNINRTELSKKTGITLSALSRMLNGHTNGSVESILKIAECEGLKIEEICTIKFIN